MFDRVASDLLDHTIDVRPTAESLADRVHPGQLRQAKPLAHLTRRLVLIVRCNTSSAFPSLDGERETPYICGFPPRGPGPAADGLRIVWRHESV